MGPPPPDSHAPFPPDPFPSAPLLVSAQGGKADAAVRCGCVPLLTRALRESMDHDHDVAHAALLSLGRLLQRTTVPRTQVMPEVRERRRRGEVGRGGFGGLMGDLCVCVRCVKALEREVLAEAISASMHRCIPKTLESVRYVDQSPLPESGRRIDWEGMWTGRHAVIKGHECGGVAGRVSLIMSN